LKPLTPSLNNRCWMNCVENLRSRYPQRINQLLI
jgi:hypothetical protein